MIARESKNGRGCRVFLFHKKGADSMRKIYLNGDKVRALLLNRFWTCRTLSDNSGVSYQTVCEACSNKRAVKMITLSKLCKALSCEPSDIVAAAAA